MSTPTPPPIKGSWEDLLNQAHRLAGNHNDEAITTYEKVISGLQRLSPAQREANKGRLQELLKTATANLHVYLTSREMYEPALTRLYQLMALSTPEERAGWRQRAGMILAQAGRHDEAFAQLRTLTAAPDATLTDWGNLLTLYLRLHQPERAAEVLAQMADWQAQQTPAEGPEKPAAYLAYLQMLVATEREDYPTAIAHFSEAMRLDPDYRERQYLLYARLMFHHQTELALPYIQKDNRFPLRAGFWHGVALKRLGRPEEAQRPWQKVINALTPQTNNEEFAEIVLTFYYLGDPEGRGLGTVLRALQSGGTQSWVLFFLAGLGWLLRDNLNSARLNLALALNRRRAAAEGHLLSPEVWQYCQDLLTPEQQAEISEYFEQR